MIPFALSDIADLRAELRKPIAGLDIERLPAGQVVALGLVRPNGTRLVVTGRMTETGARTEMGSLALSREARDPDASPAVALPGFAVVTGVWTLVSTDGRHRARSGLVLAGTDGARLTVVSAVYPYALCVFGPGLAEAGEVAFPAGRYRAERL